MPDLRLSTGCRRPIRHLRRVLLAGAAVLAGHLSAPGALRAEDDIGRLSLAAEARPGEAANLGLFLDRLMLAESGGRDDARNPRSTAFGPYQFIESTFLEVTRKHFAAETEALTSAQVLNLRSNRAFSRRAAEAFTRDNAAHLVTAGLTPTFTNLRLAFLVGPVGAVRVLKAEPRASAISILGSQVVQANPFMAGMTASDLAQWAHRNLSAQDLGTARLAAAPDASSDASRAKRSRPAVTPRCNQALASCRKWVALATKRVERRQVATAKARNPRR